MAGNGAKKSKTGLVIGIIAAVVIIAAIAGTAGGKSNGDSSSSEKASISVDSSKSDSQSSGKVEKSADSTSSKGKSQTANNVIYNKDGVKITYTGYTAAELFSSASFSFKVENNSKHNINLSTLHLNVNGYTITSIMSEDVPKGKKSNIKLDLYASELENNNIKTIGNVEFSLECTDKDTYATLFSTDKVTITLDEKAANQKEDTSKYQVVYNKNNIKVYYTGCDQESLFTEAKFNFLVENNSKKAVTVSADNMSINDYAMTDLFYAQCAAGKKTNESISVYSDDLKKNSIKELKKLEFSLECIDSSTYSSIWKTGAITINLKK